MDKVAFLTENWWVILIVVNALISILNGLTNHYSSSTNPLWKVLGQVVELLSWLSSKDSPGVVKMIGTDKKPV